MPSLSTLSAFAAFALSSVAEARPIPHTVSLFRRAILNANNGVLVVETPDQPKNYDSEHLEAYDHYQFRYTAIGCPDYEHNATFFETCCHPRKADKQMSSKYPAACNLESYLIFNPQYKDNKVTARLGSPDTNKDQVDTDGAQAIVKVDDSSSKKASESTSTTSTWTPEAQTSSSKKEEVKWTSSSEKVAAPAWTPASSSSSSSWTPEWTPSSSSTTPVWSSSSSSSTSSSAPAWTPAANVVAAAATPSDNNNDGGSSGDFTGTASWYTQNGNAGACGVYHSDSDYIVAMQQDMYGNLGQKSQYCGRSITITNENTGATAQAVVADACPGCSSYYSLDLSTGLFQALGNLDQGLLPIKWHFN